MNDIYTAEFLRLATNIPHLGHLEQPDGSGTRTSRICGSRVQVDIRVESGKIIDFAQDVKACALGQAACALVGEVVIGLSASDVDDGRQQVERLLKGDGALPTGLWEGFSIFHPIRKHSSRHTSILLIFNALLDAFTQARAR